MCHYTSRPDLNSITLTSKNTLIMKRKWLILELLLIGSLSTLNAQTHNAVIQLQNGSQIPYPLATIEAFVFQNGTMSVHATTQTNHTFSIDTISSIRFEYGTVSQSRSSIRENLRVYPNPVTNFLTVEFDANSRGNMILEIVGMEGQVFLSQQVNSGESRTEINVSSLSQGIYICRIRGNNRSSSIQFVKQ